MQACKQEVLFSHCPLLPLSMPDSGRESIAQMDKIKDLREKGFLVNEGELIEVRWAK